MISRCKAKIEWSDFRCVKLCYIRHLRFRKTANGLKEHANSLYASRWPQFSVPFVTAVNKAALCCAYEHGGKRKRKCHLKFSEESSLQILIHINPLPPIHYLYFSSYISSIVNSDLVLPATVFSLFVSVFCVVRVGSVQSVIACRCWRSLKRAIAFLCALFYRFHFHFRNRSRSARRGEDAKWGAQ